MNCSDMYEISLFFSSRVLGPAAAVAVLKTVYMLYNTFGTWSSFFVIVLGSDSNL